MSGLRDLERPTEGKEEATEVIADLLSSPRTMTNHRLDDGGHGQNERL
jgi:hypothetical protein